MLAYKFLDRDGGTALSGYRWVLPTGDEPGAWLEVAEVRPCHSGIHACRAGDLAYWLHQELWQVELDGELTEADRKVVARRGRLVRRVGGWSGDANVELFAWCAWRVRDLAAGALRAESQAGWAEQLSAASTLRDLAGAGRRAVRELGEAGRAATLAGYAGDAAALSGPEHVAAAPFVTACAMGHAASTEAGTVERDETVYAEAFAAERAAQSRWIAERLGL